MKTLIISIFTIITSCMSAMAQIGYQVAIVDPSSGKPKTNETLSVTVTLSDNAGTTIFTDTQNATTNEFGVVSLQVGNSDTFSNVDWAKLPLWVSASVGGVTIGKTQVLSVPVAEHAKHYGELTKEILTSKVWNAPASYGHTLSFHSNGTAVFASYSYHYYFYGNLLVLYEKHDIAPNGYTFVYIPEINALYYCDNHYLLK